MAENFANEYQTTLNGAINNSTTSVVVTSDTGAPAANFRIRVDDEYMLVTAKSGTTFTVTRGVEGSTAASHSDGATVTHVLTAGGLSQALSESGSTSQMDQLTGDVSMSSGLTWFDGPTLSLAAGTYVLMGTLTIVLSGSGRGSARLSDGTNHLASTEQFQGTASRELSLSVSGRVVVSSTTTWKLQGAPGSGLTGTIKAANPVNATGNIASTLTALKTA
jgi:hypothetical protein